MKKFNKTGSDFLNSLGSLLGLDNDCSVERLASLTKISIAYINCYYIGKIYHDVLKYNLENISEKKLQELCNSSFSSYKKFFNVKKLKPLTNHGIIEKLKANFSNQSKNIYFKDDLLNCNLKKMNAQSATKSQKKKFSDLKNYNNYYEALFYCKGYYSLKELGIEEYIK